MRLRKMVWFGLAATGMLWPRLSPAQTIEDRIQVLEDKIKERGEAAQQAIGMDVHALVMTDYNADFNNPPGNIPLSTFNFHDNTFSLRDAALFLSRNRPDESFGFGLTVDFGDTARAIQARWGGSGGNSTNLCGSSTGSDCFVEVREAFLTYNTPLKMPTTDAPISLKAGKFVTLLGYEVIPTYANFNPNLSTSLMFGFAIPFTHTGLLVHMPVLDQVAFDVGVVNGWDNVADNNNSKTFLGGVGITPTDAITMYISGMYGAENNSIANGGAGAGSTRGIVSGNASWKVIDQLQLAIDSTWANESNIATSGSGAPFTNTAYWYGVAGYVIVQPIERLQIALRAEWFDDPEGVRTGAAAPGSNAGVSGQTLWEITPTVTYSLTDHVTFRTEYRHDQSNQHYFETGSGNFVTGQDSVFTELIFAL